MRLRGGGGGINDAEAQAIKNIKNGTTERQRKRDFRDKLSIALPMAGFQVAGGLAQGYESMDRQGANKAKQEQLARWQSDKAASDENHAMEAKITQRLIAKDKATDRATMASSEQYAAPDYTGPKGPTQPVPAWLEEQAKTAKAQIGANASAELSNVGGYSSKAGRENDAAQADMLTRDIATAKQGIQHGGMMGSLAPATTGVPAMNYDDEYYR